MLELVIGNKNYSSWSMRAWILLKFSGLDFRETRVSLYRPESREQVYAFGGETGLVPVLVVDGHPIWDTMAIIEFVYEQCPHIWPAASFERARARSYAGEVYSGLSAVRAAMPCNTRARNRVAVRSPEVEQEIARIQEIWGRAQDEWLFGTYSAADIVFSPVAARFRTYGVTLPGRAGEYCQRLLQHHLAQEWFAAGESESETIHIFELPVAS